MPLILWVLVVAALVPYLLAMTNAYFRVRQFGRFDNNYPRLQQSELRGIGARVQAAQANSWESLSVFGVSVFIAYAAGVDLRTLDAAALVFLAARIAFVACYVANLAWLRSLVFVVGVGCCVYVVVQAARHAA